MLLLSYTEINAESEPTLCVTRKKMYAKLIKCDVAKNQKQVFSAGQQAWKETANANGFIKQFGGWNSDQAVIVAFWEDKNSIKHFMNTLHDPIAAKANQADTYTTINVSYLKQVMSIPCHDSSSNDSPQFIRLANCRLLEGREQEFLATQQNVWNAGMAETKGMLGGHVFKCEKEPLDFVVITFWYSAAAHQEYEQNKFAELKAKVQIKSHISELSGNSFLLESSWSCQCV